MLILSYLRGVRLTANAANPLTVQLQQAENDIFRVNFPTYSAENPLWTQAVAALPEDFPAGLWAAQNAYIAAFNTYMGETAVRINEKRAQIPDQETMWQRLLNKFGDWADYAATAIEIGVTGWILKALAMGQWGMSLFGVMVLFGFAKVYDWIKQAIALEEVIDENQKMNTELLNLPRSRENYLLRLKTISIQQQDIHNKLMELEALESAAREATGGKVDPEKGTLADVVQALNDLAMNTDEIDLGGIRILHNAKVVSVVS
jgi:hypothetical protein